MLWKVLLLDGSGMKRANGNHRIAVTPLKYETILQTTPLLKASYLFNLAMILKHHKDTHIYGEAKLLRQWKLFEGNGGKAPKLR